MTTLIQINVTNNSPSLKNFFFFQQPSIYTGGVNVYSNSLLSTAILPSSQGGSTYTFLLNLQFYAGVQQQFTPPEVGQPSGYTSAIQAIGLTPAAGGTPVNNCSTMLVNPLGLTPPTAVQGVQPGAFRIVSPSYNPALYQYNGGSAVKLPNGGIVLSNFVTVDPGSNLDCQPVLKFFVQTGQYTAGTVMNFTSSSVNSALCDATSGFTTFNVTYNADGTWSVVPSVNQTVLKSHAPDSLGYIGNSVELNADIKNEAGTQVICRGSANNFNSPVVINNLTNPAAINLNGEYQVGPTGGPYSGKMCINKNPSDATFS
ncbi:Uncharacterised protein [Serratia quinivorans]|uniref:hypothetical protein n=1 Tax=Serratia TaxID=613 RepID=UPI001F4C4BF5|nr:MULTISPECIES: hypothetical protein [Serratia]ULG18764.1 hypothetical protein R10p_00040 [Serratia proteamaculans]CAI1217443.1 Uncharacterised protein [Serratia quinivorans]